MQESNVNDCGLDVHFNLIEREGGIYVTFILIYCPTSYVPLLSCDRATGLWLALGFAVYRES
jgi:hypothetical protein